MNCFVHNSAPALNMRWGTTLTNNLFQSTNLSWLYAFIEFPILASLLLSLLFWVQVVKNFQIFWYLFDISGWLDWRPPTQLFDFIQSRCNCESGLGGVRCEVVVVTVRHVRTGCLTVPRPFTHPATTWWVINVLHGTCWVLSVECRVGQNLTRESRSYQLISSYFWRE